MQIWISTAIKIAVDVIPRNNISKRTGWNKIVLNRVAIQTKRVHVYIFRIVAIIKELVVIIVIVRKTILIATTLAKETEIVIAIIVETNKNTASKITY